MPLSMPNDISAKLWWGDAHAQRFEERADRFFREYPCGIARKFNPETLEQEWWVEHFNPYIPSELALIFGDALAAYRSALDYAAADCVTRSNNNVLSYTQFPVCAKKPIWASVRASRRDPLEGMHPNFVAEIERLQPCFTSDSDLETFLNVLHAMGNIDKHRRLHLMSWCSQVTGFSYPVPGEIKGREIFTGPLERGTVLVKVTGAKGYVNFHFTPHVAIDEPLSGAHHRPVNYVLGEIRNQVEKVVERLRAVTI